MAMSAVRVAALVAVLLPLAAARSVVLDPRDDVAAVAEAVAEAEEERRSRPYSSGLAPGLVPYYESTLRPCPALAPAEVDVDELLGPWHLALLLLADRSPLDGVYAEYGVDDSLCAAVELVRTNGSMLRMDWQLHQLGLPRGISDLQLRVPVALVGQQALWALATPLGGEMLGTVTHAVPRSHLALSICGDPRGAVAGAVPGAVPGAARGEQGGSVHVLTALLTRSPPSSLGSLELLRLSGFMFPARGSGLSLQRVDQRLLSWGQC